MLLFRKSSFSYIMTVAVDRCKRLSVQIRVLLHKSWDPVRMKSEKVVPDKHLAVTMRPCSDSDGRNVQPRCDFGRKRCGNTLQHHSKSTRFLNSKRIFNDAQRGFYRFSLNFKSAKPVHRLWG